MLEEKKVGVVTTVVAQKKSMKKEKSSAQNYTHIKNIYNDEFLGTRKKRDKGKRIHSISMKFNRKHQLFG